MQLLLDYRIDENYRPYFVWIDENSQEERINCDDSKNILVVLQQAMMQAKKSPQHQEKTHAIGPKFKELLLHPDSSTDASFIEAISQWTESIQKKDPQQLQAELEKIRLTYLKDKSGYGQNKDLEGYTSLHRAIIAKDLPLINALIANSTDKELEAPHYFPAFMLDTTRKGDLIIKKQEIYERNSYLYYLTDNLTLEEFKQIWQANEARLKPLMVLFPNNSLLDNACRKQRFPLANFLVSLGFNLSLRKDSWNWNYVLPSDSSERLEFINQFFNILEKQSDKKSSMDNLKNCFEQIGYFDQKVLQQVVLHPYILANQAFINDLIKTDKRLVNHIYRLSDESLWDYFLTRHTLSPEVLNKLISDTIQNDNLPLLLYLEKKFSAEVKIDNATLVEATSKEATSIINFLLTERKINPCLPATGIFGSFKQTMLPICAIPQGSTSTKVIEAYAKAMGNEKFCNMMLQGPDQPLAWISGSYGAMHGSLGVSRQQAVPTLIAKEIIQNYASPTIRMQFDFGERLVTILEDKALLELVSIGYHHEDASLIKSFLDHIIENKDQLLIYSSHKEALNLLIKKIRTPQNKSLSEKGIEQVEIIAAELQEADMQLTIAKEIGSKHFKKEEGDRDEPVPTVDWLTRKEFIEHPEKNQEINDRRKEENLPPLGEQLNRGRPDTLAAKSVVEAWYLPQNSIKITVDAKAKSNNSVGTEQKAAVKEEKEVIQPNTNLQLDVREELPVLLQKSSKDETLKREAEVRDSEPLLTVGIEERRRAELTKAEKGFISALEIINSRINDTIDNAKKDERYIPAKEKAVKLHDDLLSTGRAFFIDKEINAHQFKQQCHEAIGNAKTELDWSDVFSLITSAVALVCRELVKTAGRVGLFATQEPQLNTITEEELDKLDNSLQRLIKR